MPLTPRQELDDAWQSLAGLLRRISSGNAGDTTLGDYRSALAQVERAFVGGFPSLAENEASRMRRIIRQLRDIRDVAALRDEAGRFAGRMEMSGPATLDDMDAALPPTSAIDLPSDQLDFESSGLDLDTDPIPNASLAADLDSDADADADLETDSDDLTLPTVAHGPQNAASPPTSATPSAQELDEALESEIEAARHSALLHLSIRARQHADTDARLAAVGTAQAAAAQLESPLKRWLHWTRMVPLLIALALAIGLPVLLQSTASGEQDAGGSGNSAGNESAAIGSNTQGNQAATDTTSAPPPTPDRLRGLGQDGGRIRVPDQPLPLTQLVSVERSLEDPSLAEVWRRPAASRANAVWKLIEALDRGYSSSPHAFATLERGLFRLAHPQAAWRSIGTTGALADAVALEFNLTVYNAHPALLPTEVVAHQGGSPFGLAMLYALVAGRLDLPVIGFVQDATRSDTIRALVTDELAAPRIFSQSGRADARGTQIASENALQSMVQTLYERELVSFTAHLWELRELHRLLDPRDTTRWRQQIELRTVLSALDHQQVPGELELRLIVACVNALPKDVLLANQQWRLAELLREHTPKSVLLSLRAASPTIMSDGASVDEWLLRWHARDADVVALLDYLNSALTHTPQRADGLANLCLSLVEARQELSPIAGALLEAGQRQPRLCRATARMHLVRGNRSAAYSAICLRMQELEHDPSARSIHDRAMLAQALVLASEFRDKDGLAWLSGLARTCFGADAALLMALAESWDSLGERQKARDLFRYLHTLHPNHARIRERLNQLNEKW